MQDPRDAKEIVSIVLLPQVLLCGFFVSVDNLPNWIAWAHWLMPLTYAFRLFIAEEFSTCLDFTIDEQYTINCIRSFRNAVGTSESLGESLDRVVYNDTSVMTLSQTWNSNSSILAMSFRIDGLHKTRLLYIRTKPEYNDYL
jgi:hypothetical protein